MASCNYYCMQLTMMQSNCTSGVMIPVRQSWETRIESFIYFFLTKKQASDSGLRSKGRSMFYGHRVESLLLF